jgi:methyl-accepting chemotaxis protein
MEQVTENIDRLNGHIEKQSTAVSESSAAVEEMIASIRSVTDTVSKNSANVKTLERASDAGRTSLRGVVADIQEIARESESLLEINSVMENIAGKTNLLSMNAAIEAAKAGEVGKGFAVVAGEIRKLSISSEEQSKTVSTVLKKIKDSIDKITMSTEDVQGKFEAIDSGVKIVADQEEIILHTMEEQMRGSKQILQAIGQVNEITGHVKGGSARMLEGSREVIRESRNLETITREINGGMNEMSLGANQIDVAVSQVTGLGAENGKSIDTLLAEVSRFKVD